MVAIQFETDKELKKYLEILDMPVCEGIKLKRDRPVLCLGLEDDIGRIGELCTIENTDRIFVLESIEYVHTQSELMRELHNFDGHNDGYPSDADRYLGLLSSRLIDITGKYLHLHFFKEVFF